MSRRAWCGGKRGASGCASSLADPPPPPAAAAHLEDVVAEEPRLAARRVDVRVRAEEGLEGARLVPARHELRGGVAEEAADVRARKREARDACHGRRRAEHTRGCCARRQPPLPPPSPPLTDREQHGRRHGEVLPLGRVVARPDGAPALRAREEGAREDEGAKVRRRAVGVRAARESLGRGALLVVAVEVVPLAVLDARKRLGVAVHGHLGAVDWWGGGRE